MKRVIRAQKKRLGGLWGLEGLVRRLALGLNTLERRAPALAHERNVTSQDCNQVDKRKCGQQQEKR